MAACGLRVGACDDNKTPRFIGATVGQKNKNKNILFYPLANGGERAIMLAMGSCVNDGTPKRRPIKMLRRNDQNGKQ